MLRISLLSTAFTLVIFTAFSQNIIGSWKGTISISGQRIPIVFHFNKDDNNDIKGKWDSPLQNAKNLPFGAITTNDDSIKIDIPIISGSYTGAFINKDSITGIWHQASAAIPLNFVRFTDTTSITKVYPGEKEISISSSGDKIYGTLLSKNNRQKLAIIIAGSGPTDRDGNNPMGDKADSYKLLAHALDSAGIASFRYDKRGVGSSIPVAFKESNIIFEDYIHDAENIYNYLHDTLSYKNIYFLGHSEGSLIGMAAAQKTNAKGYISIAGAGRPIDEIVEEQMKSQLTQKDSLQKKVIYIFNELKQGKQVNDVPQSLQMLFRKSIQPYMISWLKYSPANEIKKVQCPVLILQGGCDKQVKILDADNLHNANKKSLLEIIPLMTHTLKNADAGCKDDGDKTYTDPSLPLNKELAKDIVQFINKN